MQTSNLSHWKDVLQKLLKEELPKAKDRVGHAAEDGDWHENAEFEDAERQLEFVEARIEEVKRLIRTLEKNSLSGTSKQSSAPTLAK